MALEKLYTRIEVEMTGETQHYAVMAKQGDKATRYVIANLLNNGNEYIIPQDAKVTANIIKPDKKYVYNECDYSGSEVTIELKKQSLSVAGVAYCDIEIQTSDKTQIITSASFEIQIEKSQKNENAILSSNEFTELEMKMENIDATNEKIEKDEEARSIAENKRKNAENERNIAEDKRRENETKRIQQEQQRERDIEQAIENINNEASESKQATENCRKATEQASNANQEANTAAMTANAAAKACQGIVNGLNTMVDTVTKKSCVLTVEDGILTIREAQA